MLPEPVRHELTSIAEGGNVLRDRLRDIFATPNDIEAILDDANVEEALNEVLVSFETWSKREERYDAEAMEDDRVNRLDAFLSNHSDVYDEVTEMKLSRGQPKRTSLNGSAESIPKRRTGKSCVWRCVWLRFPWRISAPCWSLPGTTSPSLPRRCSNTSASVSSGTHKRSTSGPPDDSMEHGIPVVLVRLSGTSLIDRGVPCRSTSGNAALCGPHRSFPRRRCVDPRGHVRHRGANL